MNEDATIEEWFDQLHKLVHELRIAFYRYRIGPNAAIPITLEELQAKRREVLEFATKCGRKLESYTPPTEYDYVDTRGQMAVQLNEIITYTFEINNALVMEKWMQGLV